MIEMAYQEVMSIKTQWLIAFGMSCMLSMIGHYSDYSSHVALGTLYTFYFDLFQTVITKAIVYYCAYSTPGTKLLLCIVILQPLLAVQDVLGMYSNDELYLKLCFALLYHIFFVRSYYRMHTLNSYIQDKKLEVIDI